MAYPVLLIWADIKIVFFVTKQETVLSVPKLSMANLCLILLWIISWYALTLHFSFMSASSITQLNFPLSNMFFFFVVQDVLTKENIAEPMRDIRRALLEADVCLISTSAWFLFVFFLFPFIILCGTYFAGKFTSSKKIYWVCKWKGCRHRCDPRCPTWPAVGEGIPIL